MRVHLLSVLALVSAAACNAATPEPAQGASDAAPSSTDDSATMNDGATEAPDASLKDGPPGESGSTIEGGGPREGGVPPGSDATAPGSDAGTVADAGVHVITFQNFDTMPPFPGWSIGAQSGGAVRISTDTTQNFMGSPGSIVGSYPAPSGGVYVWGAYDLSALALEDIYVEFWARMPKTLHGLKFLKVFGGNAGGDTSNYANTTFGLDYTGVDFGCMYQVSFGDGTNIGNDVDNVVNFDGSYPNWIGRSYGHGAVVQTPQMSNWASSNWGTSWHHFRLRTKFNSGTSSSNEVADGAYYVEIDGKVYVNATGLFNRNPSNAPIDRIEIFGWSQNGTAPFEIWYDNLTISTGGFAP